MDFLNELNESQKKAAAHVSGPLLIVAGAGTGKTKVITSRIANLILSGTAKSSEILALTFTEKAMEEMIERVDVLMPLGYEEIWIKTFHGFCDRVLRERGHEIGIDPGYKLFSKVDQWLLLKKNLFALELDYFRPMGNPSRFLFTLLEYFSRLKDECITPEEFAAYCSTLPEADEIQKEERKKFLELAHVYAAYQKMLIAENALDFGDLVYFTLQLLEKRPSVLNEYQERYKYIMVDEFQDTNYSQTRLILLLAKKSRNLVVVGDDDQSIYRWRGASLSNILEFEKSFPGAEKVILTDNYRSDQKILDAAYLLIQNNNPDRLEFREHISKKLVAKRGDVGESAVGSSAQSPVQIWHFQHFFDEVRSVCDDIERGIQGGVSPRDMAILGRSNQHLKAFVEELKSRKIPYQVRTPQGIFSLEEVKDLLAVARLISNPSDDIAMYRYLQFDVFGIPMDEIVSLYQKAKKEYLSLYDCFKKNLLDPQPLLLPEISKSDSPFHLLSELISFSQNKGPLKILLQFLYQSKYLQRLVDDERFEAVEKVQNLHRFGRFVDHFEKTETHHSLYDFLEYVELLEEAEGGNFEQVAASDYDAVQLLTVHSSKGLEFPTVYVVNSVQHRFPSISRGDPLEIPEALAKEHTTKEDYHLQEERRLMYVACTRARDRLVLTHSDAYEGKKKWKPSVFLDELAASAIPLSQDFPASGKNLESFLGEASSKYLAGARLHKLSKKLSYSQFDTFQTCPLKYRYRYLFPIPTPQSHAANFGSSVHNALNFFYRTLKRGEAVSWELMQGLYEQEWIPYGYESKAHENKQKERGLEMLRVFYEKNSVPEFVVPFALERNFNLKVGEFSISGRIDRIDALEDGTYEVIDYKTGSSKRDSNLSKDLQLSLYAWACRDVFQIPVSKLSLYFIADQEKNSTTRSDEEIEKTKLEILELALELQKSEFQPTPGFHCQYCDYRLVCPAV